jgi:hypothetical protein
MTTSRTLVSAEDDYIIIAGINKQRRLFQRRYLQKMTTSSTLVTAEDDYFNNVGISRR